MSLYISLGACSLGTCHYISILSLKFVAFSLHSIRHIFWILLLEKMLFFFIKKQKKRETKFPTSFSFRFKWNTHQMIEREEKIIYIWSGFFLNTYHEFPLVSQKERSNFWWCYTFADVITLVKPQTWLEPVFLLIQYLFLSLFLFSPDLCPFHLLHPETNSILKHSSVFLSPWDSLLQISCFTLPSHNHLFPGCTE